LGGDSFWDPDETFPSPASKSLQFLEDRGLNEDRAAKVLREQVLGKLQAIATEWVSRGIDRYGPFMVFRSRGTWFLPLFFMVFYSCRGT